MSFALKQRILKFTRNFFKEFNYDIDYILENEFVKTNKQSVLQQWQVVLQENKASRDRFLHRAPFVVQLLPDPSTFLAFIREISLLYTLEELKSFFTESLLIVSKQVNLHVEITMVACDVFVNVLKNSLNSPEIYIDVYYQILHFKAANDTWLFKSESLSSIACQERINHVLDWLNLEYTKQYGGALFEQANLESDHLNNLTLAKNDIPQSFECAESLRSKSPALTARDSVYSNDTIIDNDMALTSPILFQQYDNIDQLSDTFVDHESEQRMRACIMQNHESTCPDSVRSFLLIPVTRL